MQTYFYQGPVCDLCKKIASACDCSARKNTAESPGTYKQQLQAKIADLIEWYDIPISMGLRAVNRAQVVAKLQQLLAVQ